MLKIAAGRRTLKTTLHRLISRTSPGRQIELGDMARDAKRWAEACFHYEAALKANPELDHIWVQLGHARQGGR